MTESLRYTPDAPEPVLHTRLDFSDAGGFLAMAEKCNGSGDCRKLPTAGGAMCPSYHATRQEQDTTRGRANVLREFMTHPANTEAFGQTAIYEVLQWCLSCKACAHECPSSVDMSLLKAEFLHQYHRIHGLPFRTRVIGSIGQKYRLAARFPTLSNFFLENPVFSKLLKGALGFHPARKLPRVESSLETWYKRRSKGKNTFSGRRRVYFFFDEFTTCQETAVGKAAIQLLEGLGYEVAHVAHQESGRAYLSKGMLDEAGWIAMENTRIFSELIHAEMPLVGVEPSAIYTFRDEYPRLVERGWQAKARELGQHVMLVDDFIAAEIQAGRITPDSFTRAPARILFHGHCHQKALADVANSVWMLSLPKNYSVEVIPSGCCGMAGSFGFEKENYALSQQIGEQVLFPALRKAEPEVLIAATGTSCRHQIEEGVERKAMHPIEIIWAAFKTHS